MSDFTSNFWAVWVAGITLAGIIGCGILLWVTARKKVVSAGDNTTGHVWDEDLSELNNPMPRWWMWLFVITIVFGLLYLVAYPGLGSYQGQLQWSTRGEYAAEMAQAEKDLAPLYAQFANKKIEDLARDPNAMAVAQRLFLNNCSQCHGSDARGGKGFPNLTAGRWLHGGTPERILETITKGRVGMMPPMAAAVGTADDVKNVANYVMSLSGSPNDSVRAQLGKPKFVVCAACHGPEGKGNQDIGAPNLNGNIWLHGYGVQAVMNMINNGKTNVMPAQGGRLTEAQIRVLAAYVWGLSNKP